MSTITSVVEHDLMTTTPSMTEKADMEPVVTTDTVLSFTEAGVLTPNADEVLKSQEKAADHSVCVMIKELISSMHVPLKIQNNTERKNVSTQAGFSCFKCDLSFLTTSALLRHNRIKHAFFPFRCLHCKVGYTTIAGLTSHLKISHDIVVKKVK